MKKDSFVAYVGWSESTETLSDAQAGQLFRAVFRYTATGEAVVIDDPAVAMAFQFIRRDIDRDARLYNERCEANRENGSMGGRPKKAVGFQETEKSERFFKKPKKADNDNDNDNDIYIHSLTPRAREGELKTFGTFGNVKLSDGDVEALRMAFSAEGLPDDFLDRAIERLSAFMAQEGRPKKAVGFQETEKSERFFKKPKKADNDNDNDNDIYIHSLTPRAREGELKTFGTFGNVKLSDGDVEALRMAFSAEGLPDDFLDRAIERLSAFMAQEGRSYKNHRAAILGWVKTAVMEDDKKTGRPSRKPQAADPFEAERKVWASMSEEDRNEYLNTHGGKYPWQQ